MNATKARQTAGSTETDDIGTPATASQLHSTGENATVCTELVSDPMWRLLR